MPKVSVILSSYNHADYVAEAIESVLGQTFRDFELLVYDDGSTDGSADVIRSFRDERMTAFLYEENRGPLEASREAAAAARGEYIAVHHSDDAWEPDKLEKQVRFLDEHPEYAACFTLVKYMDENSEEYVPPEGSFYRTVFQQPNRTQAEWLRHFFFHGNCLCHPSLLIRREMYEAHGLLRTEGIWQLPDFCMWVKLSLHEHIYVYQEPLTRFRLRRGKQTQTGGERADVSIRSQFELYQILKLYTGITQRKMMMEVFPESAKYLSEESGSILFSLAMEARSVGSSAYQMLALDILYGLVRDKDTAGELAERYHYTWRDFVSDTGKEDVFHTASLLTYLHLMVYADDGSGTERTVGDGMVYVSSGGEFFAEFPLEDSLGGIRAVAVDICDNTYRKLAITGIRLDGQPVDFSPVNGNGKEGPYDVFLTVCPQYSAVCHGEEASSVAISGIVDFEELLDVRKILYDKDLELVQRHMELEQRDLELEQRNMELAQRNRDLGQCRRELDKKKAELESRDRELEQRDQELAAIKATRGWRALQWARDVRDSIKSGVKGTAYRCLATPGVKCLAREMDGALRQYMPSVHQKVYLPLLARAKQHVMSCSVGEPVIEEGKIPFWHFHPGKTGEYAPLVSIIVPNYNHGAYLRERLDSIYSQTYGNYEVILLDDCSTDDSRDILREYGEKHPDTTRLAFNEKNSGNVFAQWKKGLSLAKGELIWIAESDDWCETGFLQRMVAGFRDEAVMLAFCRSDFMQDGVRTYTTEDYLKDLPGFDWGTSFCITAAQAVAHAFSIKNIIPNVSSAVFRKPLAFSSELQELWEGMRLCGDWAFYMDIMKGGCLFYTPETTNFYRVHASSTSLKIQKEARYYEEHESIARFLARNYRVPRSSHERHLQQLEEHYLSYFGGKDPEDVAEWFRIPEILKEKRRPNVLMCLFSMSIGGGETFPLALANELKRDGIPVAVLDFQMSEDMPGIRSNLRADVPYIRLKETEGLATVAWQLGADIAHSHHGSVDEAVHYAVPQVPGLRQVITLHGMYESTEEQYLKPLLDKVRETCAAFVYIADKNLVPFREYGGFDSGKFIKIGNGLAYSTGTPIPRGELGVPEDAFLLCVVSRAIPEKGWQPAMDAVLLAREKAGRDIHLLLVGGGEMYDRLLGKVPDCIHLMGFQSNVRDYFATADMGLLPSEFKGESFPLMIIDCLFCGKPVIASDLGESRNQLLDESGNPAGEIFELVDGKVPVETLANMIVKAADNEAYYEILRQRVASASEKFRMERVAADYMKVYESVLGAEG